MKIIHTADWHLGKILHRQDLYPDMSMFFDWLIAYIKNEHIDMLLVAGDVFDSAYPAHRDSATYYTFLHKLSELKIKIIITGGNHDSISLLDAPAGILDTLNISVIGGARSNLEQEIIPCYHPDGDLVCVVLAVPFLRDKDLRQSLPASEMGDKNQTNEASIRHHYQQLVEIAIRKYGNDIPIIGMGHLYMKGSITSDSERDIHIGNLGGMDTSVIPKEIDYMALGHIHKPQKVSNMNHIRYCGSPVFLDFSEREYQKCIIQINIENQKISEIKSVPVPCQRDILKFTGTLDVVKASLAQYKNTRPLSAFIELEVMEDAFNVQKMEELDQLKENMANEQYKILKSRLTFTGTASSEGNLPIENTSISDLSPTDIFKQKLAEGDLDASLNQELLETYQILMEEIYQHQE
jgi:exonuclease SbcD